jgi:hypothetical protein
MDRMMEKVSEKKAAPGGRSGTALCDLLTAVFSEELVA